MSTLVLMLALAGPALADGGSGGEGADSGPSIPGQGGAGGTIENPAGEDGGDVTDGGLWGAGGGGGGGGGAGGGQGGSGGAGLAGSLGGGGGDGGDGGDGGVHGFVGFTLPPAHVLGDGGTGGQAGDDSDDYAGGGGGGGAGGYGAIVVDGGGASFGPGQSISAGSGGSGGNGGNGNFSGLAGDGGSGGDGGIGVSFSGDALINEGVIVGGTGGTGGAGGTSGGGGEGAGGGAGIGGVGLSFSGDTLTNVGVITGGNGGNGGDGGNNTSGAPGGDGGDAADGGAGLSFSGGTLTNTGGITGGNGGNGGAGGDSVVGLGGDGGRGRSGGSGIAASSATIINEGTITGGDGGSGGAGGAGGSGDGVALPDGSGGAGVAGSGLSIVNSGTISGGGSSFGQGNAIFFAGGTNRLELHDGFTINGTVRATSGGDDTLALGGNDNGDFDVSEIAPGGTGQYLGFEAFEKTGASTWTLTSTTSAATPWTIEQGTLSVSSDGNLGAASGVLTFDGGALQTTATLSMTRGISLLAGGGTIAVDTGAVTTFGGSITGDGALVKSGAGQLVLGAAGDYTGGTTIADGRLIVEANGALGTGPVVVEGLDHATTSLTFDGTSAGDLSITVDNGRLNFYNGASAGNATIVNNEDFLNFFFSETSTAGSATIDNSGEIIFTEHSGAADATITNKGRVYFADSALAGSATFVNRTAGFLFFNDGSIADDATIVGEAGSFVDLSGHTGGLGIGSLSGDGDVVLGGNELTVGALGLADTIGGVIQDGGAGGSLVKIGAGELELTGASTYTGVTTVNGGLLTVNGDISSSSLLTVGANGMLGGVGTVGTTVVAAGGIHAPGNSIGTQTIASDYANHGSLVVEATPDAADRLVVNGMVDISGATLELLLSPTAAADWDILNGPYTLIANDGADAVTGTFDSITKNLVFLDQILDYAGGDGNDVTLELTRNNVEFGEIADTFNQRNAGNGVDSVGPGNPLWNAAVMLDEVGARTAFDQLSGEAHASVKGVLIDDSRFVRDAATDRIRAAFDGVGATDAPVMAYDPESGMSGAEAFDSMLAPADTLAPAAWGRAFGAWRDQGSDGNAAAISSSTGGFLTGIEGTLGDSWRAGIVAGYSHTSFDVDDRASSGSSTNWHLGLYGGTQWGNLGLRAGAAYTWHDIETARSVAFPGFSDTLSADYGAGTAQLFGELGYRIDTAVASLEPFANLAYVNLHTDGFTERGGAASLTSPSSTTDAAFTSIGLRASTGFRLGSIEATARAMLGWRHAFGDTTPLSTHALAGSNSFSIAGIPIARDAALLEAGIDLDLSPATTLGIAYQGQVASGAQDHSVNAKINVRF